MNVMHFYAIRINRYTLCVYIRTTHTSTNTKVDVHQSAHEHTLPHLQTPSRTLSSPRSQMLVVAATGVNRVRTDGSHIVINIVEAPS